MSSWFKRLSKTVIPFALHPRGLLTSEVAHRTGLRIAGGPFKGMNYVSAAVGSELVPKLLGIYERELTPVIEQLIAMKPPALIDIGAAEGYFAVGLAMRLPDTRVVAFEMNEVGRAQILELARRNSVVSKIDIRGKCETQTLADAIEEIGRCAIICDAEGYEQLLLDPAAIPALTGLPILVEVHEFIVNGIMQELRKRFAPSHSITEIAAEERTAVEYPYHSLRRKLIPGSYVRRIVNDSRPPGMAWLWLVPKSPESEAGRH